MNTTHRQRENSDIKLFFELLHQFDPFLDDSRLCCITTGVTAGEDDAINCDEVVTTGAEIQQSLDWIAASKVLVPRSKNIKNLARMSSGIKVSEKVRDSTIQINKTVLFQQLTASMECTIFLLSSSMTSHQHQILFSKMATCGRQTSLI